MNINKVKKTSKYSMEIKGKYLIVTGEGFFQLDDAIEFRRDFENLTRRVSTARLELIINTPNLKTCSPDLQPEIDRMARTYHKTTFSKKHMVLPNSSIAGLQLKRIDTTGLFKTMNFIDNINMVVAC